MTVLVVVVMFPVTSPVYAGGSHALKIGLSEDYQEHKTSDTDLRRDMTHVRESGVRHLRVAFAWDGTHTGPGTFDFSFWDRVVEQARRHDVKLVPYIGYTPRWLADGPTEEYWTQPPKDYEQFGRFVKRIAHRYREEIDSWELWTEPDNADYWRGTDTEYARLLETASNALDRVEGDQQLVLGGIAWDVDFVRRLFRDHEAYRWVDVVNAHSYFETWHPAPLERLPSYLNRIETVIDRHGHGEDLWMAEVGYSNYRDDNGRISGVYRAKYPYEHTERHQAIQLFRTVTLLQAQRAVELMTWYRLNDLPSDEPVIGDDNNRYLGIYREDGSAKPARDALRFAGQFYEGPIEKGAELGEFKLDDLNPSPLVYLFTNQHNETLVVTWFPNRYEESSGEESFPVKDDRSVDIPFLISGGKTYELTRYDVTGEIIERQILSGNESAVRGFLSIEGGEIGIYRLTRHGTNED